VSLKIQTLKLAQQLADYLTANKKLSIQGIGNFLLDTSYNPDPDNKSKTDVVGTITFESNTAAKTDDGLIEYISKQTGKMKTLAASDLESQLEIVHQFLNIGKAYALEGIGTISKSQDGNYTFTQGIALPERIAERNIEYGIGKQC
jgi:nucleoid DNA-binding protein